MNYLYEINHFYGWLTTHPISPHAQALWNLLMSIDNKAGWPKQFAVPTNSLAALLGVSHTQLTRCRKELADSGRIVHTAQTGGRPAIYSMLTFEREKLTGAAMPTTSPQRLKREKLHLVR